MKAGAGRLLAAACVAAGVVLFAFGNLWAPAALAWLPDNGAGPWLELLLPFLPMIPVAAGAMLFRASRQPAGKS